MIAPESDCRVSGARLALATGAFDDHQVQVHEDQHARRGTGPGFEQGKWEYTHDTRGAFLRGLKTDGHVTRPTASRVFLDRHSRAWIYS